MCAYHDQTTPLIAHYDRAGVLVQVDAMGPIAEVRTDLAVIMGGVTA